MKPTEDFPTAAAAEPLPQLDDPRVLLAVEEYLAAHKAGHRLERHDFLACHPGIAAALDDCLDGLAFIQAAAPQPHESVPIPADTAAAAEVQPEALLGDYRLLREIGRGGMGVVYEAVQMSLGRRVALKVLPFAATLDAKQLQRFKNEAQSAAHLHHQNIVPVYGVGCERGVHYYAMQFIDGQTVAELIHELRPEAGRSEGEGPPSRGATKAVDPQATGPYAPTFPAGDATRPAAAASTDSSTQNPAFFRTAAQLGIQAAEALEHAHQLGVVHRDIKPGNLLVDERGNLWITDFGLAHCRSLAGLTMTGDLIGTLGYMSPEQALAQRMLIDHRTDIYSLGATLYELLTLEPVFDGRDRQELLRQIAFEEPRAPRRWNKAIPAELETVVLKAMAKHPNERYATAQELANDLRCYLDDKAISARRPTLAQKIHRWSRHHKDVTRTALFSAFLLLAAVAVVASLATLWLGEEQQATRRQLHLTQQAENEATRRLYASFVAQARAGRLSQRIGQRSDSLKTLAEAVKLAHTLNLPDKDFLQLRNEAIACLVLPDLTIAKEWEGWPTGSMTVDFDGALERYARVDRQGIVHIHRVADGSEICHLAGFGPGNFGPGTETLPSFSPDGRFLMLARGGRIQVWKLAGQEPVVIVDQAACLGNAFSPDSRQFALGHEDGSIHLYDLSSGKELKQLRSVPNPQRLAFHPKAQQLAIGHPSGVQIRDLATGSVLTDLPQRTNGHIAWHPDGKTLAVDGGDRIIHLWDRATRKPTVRLEGCRADGISFTYNHAGDLLASFCWDGFLRLWDPRTGRQVFSTPCPVHSLRFSPDDQLLAVGFNENKLRLWQVVRARGYRTLVRDPVLGRGEYHTCAIPPGSRLLAVGMKDGAGLWDLPSGSALAFLPGHPMVIESAGPRALISNGADGLLRWPIQSDAAAGVLLIGPPQKLPLPGNDCWIAASRDGRALASSQRWGGLVWHQDRPEALIRLSPHEDTRNIAVSPDGRWVATGSHWGSKVKIWHARTGQLAHELPIEAGSWVRFSPDGRWLGTTGGGCRLWAVDSWQEGPSIGGDVFAFSPDGKLLAVETGHGVVRLVDPDSGREYARLEDPNQDRSHHLCFSSDGTQLVSTTSGNWSIHVWDLRILRRHLAEMGLDWNLPPYLPAEEGVERKPLQVQVDLGDVLTRNLALAKNNEAWQLAAYPEAQPRDPRRAVELAKQAVELAPKEGNCWNTLGVAHYRASNWEESIAALDRSMQLLSGRFEAFNTLFLAMAHWQRNDKKQARKCFNQAVEWIEKNKEGLKKDKLHEEELRRFRTEAATLLEGKGNK